LDESAGREIHGVRENFCVAESWDEPTAETGVYPPAMDVR
jgi:hypothetical protein